MAAHQPAENTELAQAAPVDFLAALRNAGFLSQPNQGADFHRIKHQGQNLIYNDEIIASYNAVTKEPALIVRIAGPIVEYQANWFEKDGNLARAIGRPDVAGKMCKSHFDDPNEARKFSNHGTSCDECPIMPFVPKDKLPDEAKGKKCSWKADIDLYILDKQADGTYAQVDQTLYTMSLPTTAVIEFKGSTSKKADGIAGSVSPENFMVKLAKLGMQKWGDDFLKAHTYYNLGGVIAELRPLPTSSNDGAFNYNVISFNPIDILEMDEAPALPGPAPDEAPDDGGVPF
jgi:hypothetical protein